MDGNNSKYYFIRNRSLANTLAYIMQRNYYTFKNDKEDGREIFSFENDEDFQSLLSKVDTLCKEYRK